MGTLKALVPLVFALIAPAGLTQAGPPDVAEQLAALERSRKARRGADDGNAVRILRELQSIYPKLEKKGQAAVCKAARRCLLTVRKPGQEALLDAASETLTVCGAKGGAAIVTAIDHKRYKNKKPWRQFRARLVRRLGKLADKKFVKYLIDLARKDNDHGAAAAAGDALGNYAKASGTIRKKIVKELIKALEAVDTVASTLTTGSLGGSGGGGGNPALAASQRLRQIRAPWMKTLRKLTGQRFSKVIDWRKWHEKNKRRRW